MPMTITRLDDARVFLERAGTFLTEHEAENNLLFGISHTLIHAPVFYPEHYLALVHDESQHDSQHENQPTVAALMTPPHNLILSYVPDAEALGGALDQALDLLARDIYESYPALPGVIAQTGVAERFARRWRRHPARSCALR